MEIVDLSMELKDMAMSFCKIVSQFSFVLILGVSARQAPKVVNETFPLDSLNGLEMVYAKADVVKYHGRPVVHLVPSLDATRDYSTLGDCEWNGL